MVWETGVNKTIWASAEGKSADESYALLNFERNSLDITLNVSLKRVIKFFISDDVINPNYEIEDWSSIPNERLNTEYRAFLPIKKNKQFLGSHLPLYCLHKTTSVPFSVIIEQM